MNSPFIRIVSLALVLCYLAACGSATTMYPLKVQSAADMRELRVKPEEVYVVKFVDGTQQRVEGGVIFLEQESLCLYSSKDGGWTRHRRAEIDEVYLEDTDQMKSKKNKTLITASAVLAAFLAASAGGYFIEQKLR